MRCSRVEVSRDGDFARAIGIHTVVTVQGVDKEIKPVDFDITQEESRALYANGVGAGAAFLEKWDLAEWKKKYRTGTAETKKA
jgi:hypothetical protein